MLLKEKLKFVHFDENYRKLFTEYEYELQFDDNDKSLICVRNGYGFSVERKSYAWEYFTNKYS